jgi:hypothetical protein
LFFPATASGREIGIDPIKGVLDLRAASSNRRTVPRVLARQVASLAVSSESVVVRGAAGGSRGVSQSGDRGCQSLWRYGWLSQLKGAEGRGAGASPKSSPPNAREAFVAKNHVILAVIGGANRRHKREVDGVR